MRTLAITASEGRLSGVIRLPSSKSISNRLLMISTLAGGSMTIENLSKADDTQLLIKLLDAIGQANNGKKVTELDTANAGTVFRFLTAFLAFRPGRWMLTGSYRMKQRPVGILVEALRELGARIDYLAKPGYPPLLINGHNPSGGEVVIDPGVSSQYASALLLVAPLFPGGLVLRFKGVPVSAPYITMTVRLMEQCGIRIESGKNRIRVYPGQYFPGTFTVESDWSAAAFWFEAVALADEADIFLEGLDRCSLQGDNVLVEIFANFGVESEFTPEGLHLKRRAQKIDGFFYDFSDHPDLAQAVIATCAGIGIRGTFEGMKSLHIKETDRLRAMKNELEKLGVTVRTYSGSSGNSSLELDSRRAPLHPDKVVETYGDHRMAMAFAPLVLKTGSLKIRNPEVVLKSYPDYWEHLRQSGFFFH